MRVLHVSAYYAPAFVYGGPPRSIHALCRALRHAGVDLQVFTTDANGTEALSPDVVAGSTYEAVPVRYFRRTFPASPIGSAPLAAALRQCTAEYDVVHIHGLWNRVVWAAAREAVRAAVPYVLSARGMLQPAARAHRGWRKRAAWAVMDSHVVRGASLLHATSEPERTTLASLTGGANTVMIPNGIEIHPLGTRTPDPNLIAFLGRLHPIKRLDLLIDAFAAAREQRPALRLAIGGPDEAGLRPALTARAGRHAEAVEWTGELDGDGRRVLLERASALVMCSDSESFGMSVLEAMAAAVPVIVTKTCPWADVERHGAGSWIDQHPGAIAQAIVRIVDDPASARAAGRRGRALAESRYQWRAVAEAFAAQYRALLPVPAAIAAGVSASS